MSQPVDLPQTKGKMTPDPRVSHAIERLADGLTCHVVAPRGWGKSSFVRGLRDHYEGNGQKVVVIDLGDHEIGVLEEVSEDEWYWRIAEQVGLGLGIGVPSQDWDDLRYLPPAMRLARLLRRSAAQLTQRKAVLVFVRLEATLWLRFSRRDFFAALRLATDGLKADDCRNLKVCLVGSAHVAALVREAHSPFSEGTRIPLSLMTPEEIEAEVTTRLDRLPKADEMKPPERQTVARRIAADVFERTSGHPGLVREVIERVVAIDAWREDDVVRRAVARLLEEVRQGDSVDPIPNAIAAVDDRFDWFERMPLRCREMLSVYERVRNSNDHVLATEDSFERLQMTGLVRKEGDRLVVTNSIFKDLFATGWMDDRRKRLGEASLDSKRLVEQLDEALREPMQLAPSTRENLSKSVARVLQDLEAESARRRTDLEPYRKIEAQLATVRSGRNAAIVALVVLALALGGALADFLVNRGKERVEHQKALADLNTKLDAARGAQAKAKDDLEESSNILVTARANVEQAKLATALNEKNAEDTLKNAQIALTKAQRLHDDRLAQRDRAADEFRSVTDLSKAIAVSERDARVAVEAELAKERSAHAQAEKSLAEEKTKTTQANNAAEDCRQKLVRALPVQSPAAANGAAPQGAAAASKN